MAKRILLPTPGVSRSDQTKCVKCGDKIALGDLLIKVPTLTEVGSNTYHGWSNLHASCFEEIAHSVVQKAEEKMQKFREEQAVQSVGYVETGNDKIMLNLANPQIGEEEALWLLKKGKG